MGEKDPSRRASDDTRQRIEQLAGGWDVPGREPAAEEDEARSAKLPPPPPPARTKGPTRPPPPPPAALARPAAPATAATDRPAASTPAAASAATERPTAPSQATPERPAASSPAGQDRRPAAPPRAAAPPPIIDSEVADGGRDDDATRIDPVRGDATALAVAERVAVAKSRSLEAPAAFRKRRGWSGDVLYVATVVFGGASARRELARLEQHLVRGRALRGQKLIALGADGIGEPSLDDPRLAAARDALAALEEDRSERAGQAAAAEADAAAIQRSERGEVERRTQEVKDLEATLGKLADKLAPLEKEAQGVRRRAGELRTTLGRLDDRIRDTESSLVSVRGGKADRAGIEAELATLRADRVAVAKDEPTLAAELDALTPRIATLEAERSRATRKLAEARAAIAAAAERATDELGAVKAARRVIDRGLGDLERRRDRALAALGEHLAIERPAVLAVPLAALAEIDVEIADDERRALEVREMLGSVDRRAVVRGVAVLVLIAAALGAFAWFILTRR